MNSLYVSATGMTSQQLNIDTISNNMANINTPGFKRSEINFKDLYYQDIAVGKGKNISVGLGSKVDGANKVFTQGSLRETGNLLDLAIEGGGFFKVAMGDGTFGYTRDGSFRMDADGSIVTVSGYRLEPPITIDQSFSEIAIDLDGLVTLKPIDSDVVQEIGTIELYDFSNPAGLLSASGNIYKETVASGPEIINNNGTLGTIRQGFLESANVNIMEEMTSLIVAQRAFEINSKAIKAADDMMGITNGIRQ